MHSTVFQSPFLPSLSFFGVLVFFLQGTLMLVDEFHFHRRRGLPRWERLGHPLDTLTVLAPLLLTLFLPVAAPWTAIFLALALFSCVFVTKDEWVHARLCAPGEQWLHALLFLLHPLLFGAMWVLWKAGERGLVSVQAALTFGFLCWQLLYWNGPWAPALNTAPGNAREDF
jgi:hypothetical protein